ncbi:2OG-Fe dioxygenase family protein [Comamonas sp. UBA7528]|uniref:2OG-Fe dioxygenase family protein n=1 Tax=Comamonas sp. UBA7528 TaxID=1946391 RepID=UPI0025BE498B|nr:2OG-Fe dioxygenase family protein [Comamonas sp. UBA7528]
MSQLSFAPPYHSPAHVEAQIRDHGFAVLQPSDVALWLGTTLGELHQMDPDWSDLPPDAFLRDGGRYRFRRHSCFVVEQGVPRQVPHRAHWQPVEYNALHGGMQRMFAPMSDATVALPAWHQLVEQLAALSSALFDRAPVPGPCYVEAHQFRIDTAQGIGRPTPEGAHRDGVDLVAVFLVNRAHIKGGETRVFEANGPAGQRFTLTEPWSLMLMDDARMIHESTPIQPLQDGGVRDTLVVTCRRGEFQGDKELQSVQD